MGLQCEGCGWEGIRGTRMSVEGSKPELSRLLGANSTSVCLETSHYCHLNQANSKSLVYPFN